MFEKIKMISLLLICVSFTYGGINKWKLTGKNEILLRSIEYYE